jgi:hypothetical protein
MMDFTKFDISVDAFHFDLLTEETAAQTNIKVSMQQLSAATDATKEQEKQGNVYRVIVSFDVVPGEDNFRISGQISQVVQANGFFGEADSISAADWELLSRPLVETIETLTYQVTAVALNHGVNLSFTARDGESE